MFKLTKDVRTYVGSAVFVLLVILLMLFLTFIEIPPNNKDLIVSIISMLVGGTGVAMSNLFGSHDDELETLRKDLATLKTEYQVLKSEYDRLTRLLVDRVKIGEKRMVEINEQS